MRMLYNNIIICCFFVICPLDGHSNGNLGGASPEILNIWILVTAFSKYVTYEVREVLETLESTRTCIEH